MIRLRKDKQERLEWERKVIFFDNFDTFWILKILMNYVKPPGKIPNLFERKVAKPVITRCFKVQR